MDVSSQENSIQNSNNLANGSPVYDENALKNHENMENHKSVELLNGSSGHEHQTEEIQQPASSNLEQFEATPKTETPRKRGRPKKKVITFTGSPRVLRSKSQEKPKVSESIEAPSQDPESSKEEKRAKRKYIKKDHDNEFSKIKTHLRYLLNRMKYEQNFIEAYAGEGWKGQSLEKLRPEKEIERAKSYINRYKLKVRDLFQRIERSCEEGRIPESLYDSEGLIDSEDIFCAKCGQTEVHLDNDIILCDGACERGFHQFCLDPPLLKEQVPPGDEGWLCPACDCKVDCVDLLNDSLETNLSINDGWEKVFPESAASGNTLDDISGLPSDDSEDDDYNPDGAQVENEVEAEDSSSDENDSDFSCESENVVNKNNNEDYLGLPSEDSEDDDFNPDGGDSDDDANKMNSSESDFSSDFDDLRDIEKDQDPLDEVQVAEKAKEDEQILETNMENDDIGPITAKRSVERLDYKKLHDETYGNISSDDSSDDDFSDTKAPKRRKNAKVAKDLDSNRKQKQSESLSTPVEKIAKHLDVEGTSNSQVDKDSSEKSGTKSSHKRLGEAATQRLYESFKENQYPDRNVRENLVKELNLTHNQVSKWFENARWSFNHPGKRTKTVKSPCGPTTSSATENPANEAPAEKIITPPKSRKRKTMVDDNNNTSTDSSNQTTRRSGRVQAKRS